MNTAISETDLKELEQVSGGHRHASVLSLQILRV